LQDGTLADELERLAAAGRQLSSRHVLDIFRQVRSSFNQDQNIAIKAPVPFLVAKQAAGTAQQHAISLRMAPTTNHLQQLYVCVISNPHVLQLTLPTSLLLSQICAGVAHMHSRGYAHMDIKPHNVLIRRPHSSSRGSSRTQRQQLPRPPSARQMVMTAGAGDDYDADGAGDGEETGLAADIEAGRSLVSGMI
jgi:hypothetical protein